MFLKDYIYYLLQKMKKKVDMTNPKYELVYTGTPPDATGQDADLVNAIYTLEWESDVIE